MLSARLWDQTIQCETVINLRKIRHSRPYQDGFTEVWQNKIVAKEGDTMTRKWQRHVKTWTTTLTNKSICRRRQKELSSIYTTTWDKRLATKRSCFFHTWMLHESCVSFPFGIMMSIMIGCSTLSLDVITIVSKRIVDFFVKDIHSCITETKGVKNNHEERTRVCLNLTG